MGNQPRVIETDIAPTARPIMLPGQPPQHRCTISHANDYPIGTIAECRECGRQYVVVKRSLWSGNRWEDRS